VLSAQISLASDILLAGEKSATVIEKNCDDYGIAATGSDGSELSNITVRNLKVTRNASDENVKVLVRMHYTDDSSVEDSIVEGSASNGIQWAYSERSKIFGCTVTGAGALQAGAHGIACYETLDMTVAGCKVSDTHSGAGIVLIILSTDASGAIIGNYCYGNGVDGSAAAGYGIAATGNKIVISGNQCYGNYGINILLEGTDFATVINNVVYESVSASGIVVSDTSTYNSVTGNTVYGNDLYGIYIISNNSTVSANEIYDNGADGLRIGGDDCIATGNGCFSNGAYGINIIAGADDTTVTGNRCDGNSTASFNDAGTNTFYQTATDSDPLNNF